MAVGGCAVEDFLEALASRAKGAVAAPNGHTSHGLLRTGTSAVAVTRATAGGCLLDVIGRADDL